MRDATLIVFGQSRFQVFGASGLESVWIYFALQDVDVGKF
jgi:hypothetical protein